MNRWIGTAAAVALLTTAVEGRAMIIGGVGNETLRDPGWPKGAAAIFNHAGRAAWWEGPPFGGGQWHAECRGDAKALSEVLAQFAKVDSKIKRVVVHDGTGYSFWLAPNREPAKLANAKIDWTLTVWVTDNWTRLRKLPTDLNPTVPGDASPPLLLDVYAGNLKWADVTMPKGLEVIDNRLEARGFKVADGLVFAGTVADAADKKPLAASVRVEKIEPQKTGGYKYTTMAETKTDAEGKWAIKNAPSGWVRVVVAADGYAPRVAGHAQHDSEPRWQGFDCALARSAAVSGRVLDEAGKPLAGVDVRLADAAPASTGRYETPSDHSAKTDADGRFRIASAPAGSARVWVHKSGYCRPGLGANIQTPADDVQVTMKKSATVRVTVDFADRPKPPGYIVSIAPEGGSKVGTWSGSSQIDVKGQTAFRDVPPGKYVLRGRPNPGSDAEEAEPLTIDLKGGEEHKASLTAK